MLKQQFFCQRFGHRSFRILNIPTLIDTKCISYQLFVNDIHYVYPPTINLRPLDHKGVQKFYQSVMMWFLPLNGQQCDQTNLTSPNIFTFSHLLPHLHSFHLFGIILFSWNEKIFILFWNLYYSLCMRVLWSIFHKCSFLFPGTETGKFFKPNWDDDGNTNSCSAICGYTSFNVIYVVSQTFSTISMNHYFAPTLVLLFSSLESSISTSFCVVAPCPITTFDHL